MGFRLGGFLLVPLALFVAGFNQPAFGASDPIISELKPSNLTREQELQSIFIADAPEINGLIVVFPGYGAAEISEDSSGQHVRYLPRNYKYEDSGKNSSVQIVDNFVELSSLPFDERLSALLQIAEKLSDANDDSLLSYLSLGTTRLWEALNPFIATEAFAMSNTGPGFFRKIFRFLGKIIGIAEEEEVAHLPRPAPGAPEVGILRGELHCETHFAKEAETYCKAFTREAAKITIETSGGHSIVIEGASAFIEATPNGRLVGVTITQTR